MNATMAEFSIRKMTYDDISAVLLVDEESFSAPWSREIYQKEIMENKFAHYFVVEESNEVIGYSGLWIVEDDAQITNIALLPKYRGYKIGEKLFGFSIQFAMQQGASRLSLEVRESNIVAQHLYRKFGLVPGGIRKGYYPDNKEDALVMWVNLN